MGIRIIMRPMDNGSLLERFKSKNGEADVYQDGGAFLVLFVANFEGQRYYRTYWRTQEEAVAYARSIAS